MKTKTIELYEFDELPEDVRAKVLENERYINVDDSFWSECILDEWKEKLTAMGFEDAEISYSGFSSQGDGASFTCKHVNPAQFIASQKAKGRFKNILKALTAFGTAEVCASVDRIDHHYSHENTVKAVVEYSTWKNKNFLEKCEKEGYELEAFLTETVRSLSKKIYRALESEYEAYTTDEAVIDTIKANEYTFTASGKMENL